jgi:hypothetical protein
MLKQIVDHPQFWVFAGLAWGITSDILGSSKAVKENGVTQLLFSVIAKAIQQKQTR